MSDESIQQLSRDLAAIHTNHLRGEVSISNDCITPNSGDVMEGEMTAEFKERYGRGFTLKPARTPDTQTYSRSASS